MEVTKDFFDNITGEDNLPEISSFLPHKNSHADNAYISLGQDNPYGRFT